MAPATPCAGFAAIIHSKKDRILEIWRRDVREILGREIEQSLLDDKIPDLLDVIVAATGGKELSPQAAQAETARATEHGTLRAEQGFDISQVTREFHILRRAIRKACAEDGMVLSEECRNVVDEIIDAAAAIGVGRCSQKREEIIKEGNARKISFAVHDFRTPLGAAALAAAEIADAIPSEARTPDVMEPLVLLERNIEQLSVEMEKTMREFASAFSGSGELRITQVRVHDVAGDVVEQLKLKARDINVTLSNQVALDVEVAAAPDALRRTLVNLVGNALRYTRSGGVIISCFPKEAEVDIVVQDTGLGIVAEKLTRIFEAGTKGSASPGMGFGLAIAKYLVEMQGGRVSIESRVGTGTSVTITLPKALQS